MMTMSNPIDCAARLLCSAVVDESKDVAAYNGYLAALKHRTGRHASFDREDIRTVNELIVKRFVEIIATQLRAGGNFTEDETAEHQLVEAACFAMNAFQSRL